jgi:hypothetical protein
VSSRYDELVRALEVEIPGFRIVRKDRSRFQLAIDKTLKIVTFGQLRDYLDCYQTTIGRTMYVTPDWEERDPDRRYVTLRHEAVHLRQFRRWTVPLMAFLYIFVFFPFGLAYFRARFEKEAYAETIRATYEVFGPEEARDPELRQSILEQFTSASYGWMWPFRRAMNRWYDRVLAEVESAGRPA